MDFRDVYLITVLCLTLRLVNSYTQGSCKEIKAKHPSAPSGIYYIQAGSYNLIEVYCEMGLNGGGYTFLSPKSMSEISDADLQPLITDRKSVLMRIRRRDGTQPYTVLQQLPQIQDIPIFIGLNTNGPFQRGANIPTIGPPYIFFGFEPNSIVASKPVHGIMANSINYTFTYCNQDLNSQIVMFTNFPEITPANYLYGYEFPFCNRIFEEALVNPSSRVMPPEYFMFTEFYFGGCGCYTQSDNRLRDKGILGFQIGFR